MSDLAPFPVLVTGGAGYIGSHALAWEEKLAEMRRGA